jgi:hypothetical protein
VIRVRVHIEQRGEGELSWVVLVGDSIAVSGLTKTDALREKWRLWWAQPEQREAARERITGG